MKGNERFFLHLSYSLIYNTYISPHTNPHYSLLAEGHIYSPQEDEYIFPLGRSDQCAPSFFIFPLILITEMGFIMLPLNLHIMDAH